MKAFWNRIRAGVAALTALFASGSELPADDGTLLAARLSAVQNTADFFRFFNLEAIGEQNLPDGTRATSFKPSGDAFKALVTLVATTDKEGIIARLDLAVTRSFIDDPQQCVYAADLVKSFLLGAGQTSTGDAVNNLAREIEVRSAQRTTVTMLSAQPSPKITGAPSAAYQTYMGGSQPEMLSYPSGQRQVLLRNDGQGSDSALHLIVSPSK